MSLITKLVAEGMARDRDKSIRVSNNNGDMLME